MYSKYKDAEPKDTVKRIKKIFREVGIQLECHTEKHVDGIFTSYLTDSDCHWRTEGKGTTVDFCEASAYGEAIEHVCTHYAFDISTVSQDAKEYLGFLRYPDEINYPLEKIAELSPAILEDMKEPYDRLGLQIPSNEVLIALWKRILKTETTPFTPYYSINRSETVLFPDAIMAKVCGTNGGGSGNTPEEAIGHALDEIVERWCKYEIYSRRLTPPEIPDTYLEMRCPDLYLLKKRVEEEGAFHVCVLDASLGKGYPVVCIAIIDPQTRRYLVNFGCHPQFEIALERCFTEIFQDRKVVPELIERKDMADWNHFTEDRIMCQRNWIKLLEDDLGLWPKEFFAQVPSWSFAPWQVYDHYSNQIGMKSQLDRLSKEGADIYIRNVGFLGFPVYKIYIKGISISHIDFTKEILQEFKIVERMPAFLGGCMGADEQKTFADHVFGKDSILGRMFFYALTNEEFDILHSSFLMEQGDYDGAYEILKPWTGIEASLIKRVLELMRETTLEKAIGIAERFATESGKLCLHAYFGEKSFVQMTAYYGFTPQSRQSMSGNKIRQDRDNYMKKVKQYMKEHMVEQDALRKVIG